MCFFIAGISLCRVRAPLLEEVGSGDWMEGRGGLRLGWGSVNKRVTSSRRV